MEKKKSELGEVHRKIGVDKETRFKAIQELRKTKEQDIYKFTHRSKLLKGKIDEYNELNVQLESEL